MSDQKKVKWGIIGLGGIAEKFANDLALVEGTELVAVASRDIKKANQFADKHNVEKRYGSYNQLLKDDSVDIIYIATPHNSHAEWAIKAMNARKSVLCEKPLAVNGRQVEEMIECALINDVFFMEAMWSRFNPILLSVKQLIVEGKIGEISYINADFCFAMMDSVKARVLSPELAGGALLDIGIYPIFLSYFLLGKPDKIQSMARFSPSGVDIQTDMSFLYKNAISSLSCAFTTRSDMVARIYGEKGTINVLANWHHADEYTISVNGEDSNHKIELKGMGYSYEIEECVKCLNEGKKESDLWTWQNSRDLINMLDEVRAQIGLKYPKSVE
ncbi:MAG: Gfo/Idh/MocA family oxidoreductase [Cyclobacteriaceae bacterium]|nr:Gfo/Idh/MocA family oxidoreductase [Cyclobacteriaceae bacterium]